MGLLKMGDDFMVDLNEVWISTVPELRALLERDRGNRKDGPSRYKRKAHRDITYIYLMYDFDSDILEWDEDKKKLEACRRTDRQPWQVEEDQMLLDACKVYIDILENKSSAYKNYLKLKAINEKTIKFTDEVDLSDTTIGGALKFKVSDIATFIKNQPAIEKAIDEIKTLAFKQLSGEAGVRGNAVVGLEEDPD